MLVVMLLVSKVVLVVVEEVMEDLLIQLLHLEMERQVLLTLVVVAVVVLEILRSQRWCWWIWYCGCPIFRLVNIKRIAIILNNYNLQSNIKDEPFCTN